MDEVAVPLRTSDFDYELPPELIAQTPPPIRGESRLLEVSRHRPPTDRRFSDLVELISPGDLLVLNSTRVRHARLVGQRQSGAPAEVLLLHPDQDGTWVAMVKPGSALKAGKRIDLGSQILVEIVDELPGGYRRVRIHGASAEEAMSRVGRMPLPPYINRDPTPEDDVRYQTVYAEREGSVAAPTAGLHFTAQLLDALEERGVRVGRIDLEVGPGTFKPVEVEDFSKHPMHPERYDIPESVAAAVAETRRRGRAVWAVGTTVIRALESAARDDGTLTAGAATTQLMIVPGYRFRVANRLITNFHLPRSTLLMLVAAFAGYEATLAAYRIAVERRYRFYTYGDAMVLG
jgi:S-adenosylmethionine:tRNA ribosyltransferase-isomerase